MKIINGKAFSAQIDALQERMKSSKLKGMFWLAEAQTCLIFELAKRIDEDVTAAFERLKSNPPFSYRGVHEAGGQYELGQFVTYQGSMWHCNRSTKQQPGDGSDWTLAVKHGRNAK